MAPPRMRFLVVLDFSIRFVAQRDPRAGVHTARILWSFLYLFLTIPFLCHCRALRLRYAFSCLKFLRFKPAHFCVKFISLFPLRERTYLPSFCAKEVLQLFR